MSFSPSGCGGRRHGAGAVLIAMARLIPNGTAGLDLGDFLIAIA
jgi:hypothetical protein